MSPPTEPRYITMRVPRGLGLWPLLRLVVLVGVGALVYALLRRPETALPLFWELVVPLVPLAFLTLPGLWRNLCPMATINQLPRLMRISRALPLPDWLERHGFAIGMIAFFVISSTRPLGLEEHSQALLLLLGAVLTLPLVGGLLFAGKSGFCGSICPLRPLQGVLAQAPLAKVANSHCSPCVGCSTNCPDLKPETGFRDDLRGEEDRAGRYRRIFAAVLPGYVLALHTLPTASSSIAEAGPRLVALDALAAAPTSAAEMYPRLVIVMLASLGAFFALDALTRLGVERISALFGAAAFAIFYWFNVPVLAESVGDLVGGSPPAWVLWEGRLLGIALAGGWLIRRLRRVQAQAPASTGLVDLPMAPMSSGAVVASPPLSTEVATPTAGTPPVEVPDRRTGGRRMRYLHLTVMPEGRRVPVLPGQTVLEVAEEHDLGLVPGCRVGICGCDPIYVLGRADGLSAPTEDERATAERLHFPANVRMACSARVIGDVTISLQPGVELAEPVADQVESSTDAQESELEPEITVMESSAGDGSDAADDDVEVERVLILGNGIAGVTAADHVRRHDGACAIDLVTEEAHPFYNRTSVSRLIHTRSGMHGMYLLPDMWCADRKITLWLNTRATRIDPEAREVSLGTGEQLRYDRLIIATGARAALPPVEGLDGPGIFCLRRAEDAIKLREFAQGAGGRRALVMGGGLLGLEAAEALKELGLDVAIAERADRLAPAQLDTRSSELLLEKLKERQLDVLLETSVERVRDRERGKTVELSDGTSRPVDLIVVCAGVVPNAELAREAGLEVNRGVMVDQHMRTSDPAIFAAGDVAEHEERVYGLWSVASEQAQIAAANSCGVHQSYAGSVVSIQLKLADMTLISIGTATPEPGGEGSFEVSLEQEDRYRKLAISDHKVVGAVLLGHPELASKVLAAVKERRDVRGHIAALQEGDWSVLSDAALDVAVAAAAMRHQGDAHDGAASESAA